MITNLLWGRKYLLFIAFFIISCKQDPYKVIYGKWQFYKYSLVNNIGPLTQEEFDIMIPYFIGKEVELRRQFIVLDNKYFKNPIYEITEDNIEELLIWGYHIGNPQTDLGIKKDVDIVKVLHIYVEKKHLDNRLEFVSPFEYDVGMYFAFSNIILSEEEKELLIFFDNACFHLKKVK